MNRWEEKQKKVKNCRDHFESRITSLQTEWMKQKNDNELLKCMELEQLIIINHETRDTYEKHGYLG